MRSLLRSRKTWLCCMGMCVSEILNSAPPLLSLSHSSFPGTQRKQEPFFRYCDKPILIFSSFLGPTYHALLSHGFHLGQNATKSLKKQSIYQPAGVRPACKQNSQAGPRLNVWICRLLYMSGHMAGLQKGHYSANKDWLFCFLFTLPYLRELWREIFS